MCRRQWSAAILRGGAKKAGEIGCAVVGGHTIRNPEPIYGLAVTGMVKLRHLITNARARPNDILVLTKPLGNGNCHNCNQKRRLPSFTGPQGDRAYDEVKFCRRRLWLKPAW